MTEVADRSGVPRQSIHKRLGTKTQLGAAVVSREVERLLDGLRVAIEVHSDSPADRLDAAAKFVIEHGRANAVLVAVLLSNRSLEPSGVRPEVVLTRAYSAIGNMLGHDWDAIAETVMRLAFSHLLQPTVSVDVAAERIRHAVHGLMSADRM